MNEEDFIAKGWHKLDDNLISARPPKIVFSKQFDAWPDVKKIEYLKKMASSMNQAAKLIQNERDQLNELCALKEKQIVKLSEAMRANDAMLQGEVTRMNEQRQGYHAEVARLNAQIRANGIKH